MPELRQYWQKRHKENGFGRRNSNPHNHSPAVFVAYGSDYRYMDRYCGNRGENFAVSINKVVPIDKSSTVLTILLALIFLHEGLTRNLL